MPDAEQSVPRAWPLWQRLAFRFLAILFALLILPDLLAGFIAPIGTAIDATVQAANAHLFHVRPTLVATNGSGDTSWAWARIALVLSLTIAGTAVWSIADARRPAYPRPAYPRAAYWLRTLLRYHLAAAALTYGIIKIFALQMTFPSISQLATPLGDLLPMRLSWLFIGYSVPYQIFCGVMETLAGLLLLWRRAVTLGLVFAAAAFSNVLVLNLAYDVPVKLYAAQLLLACVVLLAFDAPRLLGGLLHNRAMPPSMLYTPPDAGARGRIARRVLKAAVLIYVLVLPLLQSVERARAARAPVVAIPLSVGLYDVTHFVRNGDTLPALITDSLRWRDLVIDNARQGSVGSTDTAFWQRYRRGYFRYHADTTARTLTIWRTSMLQDSTYLFTARYAVRDSAHATLWTTVRGDSLSIGLARSPRHFPLAERQFHWISEYNR